MAKKKLGFAASLGVFLFLIACVAVMVVWLKAPPHVPLLVATVAVVLVGLFHGYSWKEMQQGMVGTISSALPAILIIMVVGVVIGLWMLGGVIPAMVYYGLQIISPKFFLLTALALCSVVSLALGSSLSTIGTVGVALFGIGSALGVNPAITVGAIVSGAYFGDKMSPLSDTTNLAPAVSGADLFDHIRHMMGTTVPTYIICVILYGAIGFSTADAAAPSAQVAGIMVGLAELFEMNLLLLLPPVVVVVMVVLRVPALPGMLAAAMLGMLCALVFQGAGVNQVIAAVMSGFEGSSPIAVVQDMVNRGGLLSMMRTIALMLISLCFAGVFECTGMAAVLVEKLLARVKGPRGLVIVTILTAWVVLLATGQQYVAIILTGRLMRPSYEQQKLAPQNLSRALEDSGTVFGAIVPHSTGAAFTEGALGVNAFQYGPYTFFGWINPLVAILLAAFGRGILPAGQEHLPAKATPGPREEP